MSFDFRLDGLLRVRRLLEEQARERLEECLLHLRHLEHSLEEAHQWHRQASAQRNASPSLLAAEMLFLTQVLAQTAEAIRRAECEKQEAEERAVTLRAAYLEARRARKMISTLRQSAHERYHIEQQRRQQRESDELHLGKWIQQRAQASQEDASSTSMTEL